MVVVPDDPPVMLTVALVEPAVNVAVAGRLAVPGFAELRLTVTPLAGAAADRFKVILCVAPPATVTLCGEKLTAAVTATGWLADT